jgi:hypothetical protein
MFRPVLYSTSYREPLLCGTQHYRRTSGQPCKRFHVPTTVTQHGRHVPRQWELFNCIDIAYPITVAARYKACTVFARSNTGIMGSNPTHGIDVCVRLVCVVLCIGRGRATDRSVKGVLSTMYGLRNWENGQGPKGCIYIYIYLLSIII